MSFSGNEEGVSYPQLSGKQKEQSATNLARSLHTLFVDCMVYRCSLLPAALRTRFLCEMEVRWAGSGQEGLFERIRRRLLRLSPEPCTEAESQARVDGLIKRIRSIDGRLLRDWVR